MAVEIPAPRLAPIARRTASSAKTVAGVVMAFWAIFLIAGIAMALGGKGESTTEQTMDGGNVVLGIGAWLIGLGLVANAFVKRGRRAADVAALAETGTGHTFTLADRKIFTSDANGAKDELTFPVSAKSAAELVAVPSARVVA